MQGHTSAWFSVEPDIPLHCSRITCSSMHDISAALPQVFVYLLRACQPEVRKALVRESLDVLIPVLDKRMAAGAMLLLIPRCAASTRSTDCIAAVSAAAKHWRTHLYFSYHVRKSPLALYPS